MDKALLARVEKQAIFHRFPRALPIAVFAIGMILTLLFVLNIQRADALARRVSLESDTSSLITELEREASENMAYLRAASALFSIDDEITEAEFSKFFADMSADHSLRGSLGIGWAHWLRSDSAAIFEATQRRRNLPTPFKIRPDPSGPLRYMAVITQLQPYNEPNTRALGFDMFSEVRRREAMDKAARIGQAVATSKIHLVQDRGHPEVAGIIIYLPVFERRKGDINPRSMLKGFVYTPVRVRDFLETAIAKTHRSPGRVTLYDGAPSPQNFLTTVGEPASSDTITESFEIAGRQWTLQVISNHARGLTRTGMLVLALGTLISFLLAALFRTATSRAADDRKVLEWLTRQSSIRDSLTRELNHRVKNTLANVLSIVALTRRRSSDVSTFADSLTGRIRALSATHDLLSRRDWKNAPIDEVVTSELAPYLDPEDPHAEVSGPDALLAPNDAMSLGLALHELATNAAKYGALSVPQGRVSVTWTMPNDQRCIVEWRELGGPPVTPPERRGFGLELVEKIVSAELNAPVEMEFAREGVRCTLVVPLRNLTEFRLHAGSEV